MKYRIKKVTANSITRYYAQVRILGFWWCGIMVDGNHCSYVKEFTPEYSREDVLKRIERHQANGSHYRVLSEGSKTQFEYITK